MRISIIRPNFCLSAKLNSAGGGDDLPCVFVLFLYSLSNPFGRGLDRNHLLELQSENKYSDNVS